MARPSRPLALLALAIVACAPAAPRPPPPPPPAVAQPPTPLPAPREDGHLPALATPLSYALSFDIDPRLPRFRGTARIAIDVPEPTSHVVLHARSLDVVDARVTVGETTQPAKTASRAAFGAKGGAKEELVLSFDAPLPKGPATLVVAYEGPFDDELSGLYRVKDASGESYVFTQFEATDARRAFPCFDEPGFKVPFELSITVPKGLLAVANTSERAREDAPPGKTTFHFTPTAPLPTYLVALAVGDLELRDAGRTTKPAIRLVTTKGKTNLGALALEATSGLVDALEKWFGIPYPYDKLDIVAVPEFAAGAMENAGLVTFREELLLLDPSRASIRARRSQAYVVAHELAHQWFGDLVTAAWWDDLWLNEGFATWMQHRIVDQWRPSFSARLDAIASANGVMDLDALVSARRIRQPVTTTSEAHEAFDGITYEKGAAVIATIERWMGEEAFRRGVSQYLRENAHKSARAEKLLTTLDRISGKDVTQMASTFLDHTGVPQVSVALECDAGNRWHAELQQEAWRPLGTKAPESEHTWTIPVCVLAQGEKRSTCADLAWGAPALVAGRGCPGWVHPNAEGAYYRFVLPEAALLKTANARAQLDVGQRIGLLSNAWAAVRSGKLPARVMLKLLPDFDDEPARQVVDQVVGILGSMSTVLVDDDVRPAFRRYAMARLAKRKKAIGWAPKKEEASGSGDEAILRRTVLWAAGEIAEDDATLREAEEVASKWLADPSSVDADVAAVALDLASRRASGARLDQLLAAARNAKTKEDRILALRAMTGFDDEAVLGKALDLVLTDEIRTHELRYSLTPALWRRRSRLFAESWIRKNWDALRKKLPGSLSTVLVHGAGVACSSAEVEERVAFYTPRAQEIEGASRPLAEALEGASLCAELRAKGSTSLKKELVELDAKAKR
ncbi:MAG: ERAP1-like C-terminal domain-containing protein [Deltaproteobacteria bacterium]|nr:ERAP1-like C-terminal domain-containing protein [Deltaproteobacteria bacterium]